MKFPSIFNKIKPQSIQQHPEKNQLNWMLELNKWKEERILTGEIIVRNVETKPLKG